MKLDTKLFDDLHRILDDLDIGRNVADCMLLRTRVKDGIEGLQQEVEGLQLQSEQLDQKYAALITIMHLVQSGSSVLPCDCGCEGCLADRKTVREAIGDWRKILDEIDQGDTTQLHAEVATVLTENEQLKERNAILEHYADTTQGLWATDERPDMDDPEVAQMFVHLKHPLPPEMREEQPA